MSSDPPDVISRKGSAPVAGVDTVVGTDVEPSDAQFVSTKLTTKARDGNARVDAEQFPPLLVKMNGFVGGNWLMFEFPQA